MSITSILFLFLFLPLSLSVYYMVSDGARECVLLAFSLLFYLFGAPGYITLFAASVLVTLAIGNILSRTQRPAGRRMLLCAGIVFNVGLLAYYKYTDFALSTVNRIWGSDIGLRHLLLPLGISFFTFKAISYLADIFSRKIQAGNPVHDALYLSFFAQIQSGPLSRRQDMDGVRGSRRERFDLFADGVLRFLVGFNKKVLLADVLAHITSEVFSSPLDRFSVAYAWLGSICYSLQLFFDFAGYSDMAIGLSEMFGYRCAENFRYPYMTQSVSKFWRRWHISLGQWFRDYVYIPLGGSRSGGKYRVYFNLLLVWALTGIWHGAAWNFVAWGLGYFILIAFERATGLPERLRTRAGKLIYRIFTLLFINFQWVVFKSNGLRSALGYLKRMFFCPDNPLADMRTLFLIKDYLAFLLAAVILCFPVVPWVGKRLERHRLAHQIYELVLAAAVASLFLWALSFVVSGQNNPFAYANF